MFRGAKKRTFRFGKKNVSFPKVETFRFADYTLNHKRTPALRYILQGSHANYFFERHIEHALGSEPTTAEKLAHRAIFTVQQLLGASHPVGIYQPLEVASEVVVHRITQVGRIRAGNERICIMLINNNIANSVEEIYLIAK